MRIALAALFAAVALLPSSGCSRPAPGPAPAVIEAGNRSELQDLDPHVCSGVAEFRALSALFEGLCTLEAGDLSVMPGAAATWVISPDGLVYTFSLQPEGRWSNGDPVVAGDFVYAWKRMLSPRIGSEYAYLLHCIKNGRAYNQGEITDFALVGVKALSDLTLEVTLERPTPYFLSMQVHFAWFPVHPATVEAAGGGERRGAPWTRPGVFVGNGPFKLRDWRPDQVLSTVRNEHYWGAAKVKPDGVNFYPVSDEQTEERMFRSGQLHLTYTVPMHKIENYRAERAEELVVAPYLQAYFYRFNTTRPPFDDIRVRTAFSLALDRDELARNVFKAGEQPARALVPPGTAGYTCDYAVPEDVERARALLAEAGFPGGKGLPPIDLLYNSSTADKLISEAVQRMWRDRLGAEVRLLNQEYKVYLDSMSRLDYDICRSTWLADVLDPVNFLECFLTGEGNNRCGFASPEYDALIHLAYQEADAAARTRHLQAAEKILLESGAIAPLATMTQKFLKSPRLQGLEPNLIGYMRWQDLHLAVEH